MVQQAAPAKTVQTLEFRGYVAGKICSDEECVLSQARVSVSRQPDSSMIFVFYDPNWPLRRFEHCETDIEKIAIFQQFLAELARLSPTLS